MSLHTELTLQAASVAAAAIRAVEGVRSVLGPPNGEVHGFLWALSTLQLLYAPPKPPKKARAHRVIKPKPSPIPEPARLLDAVRKRASPPPQESSESAWDPEPSYEAKRCQALLLEVVRRAAHDWVLYRQHTKLEMRQRAQHAYMWIFEEEPGHKAWKERDTAVFLVENEEGQSVLEVGSRRLTSFISICEIVGLEPEAVRARAREMTVESISKTGRHTERRRGSSDSSSVEPHSVVVDIDLDALDNEPLDYSQYGGSAYDSW